MVDHRVCFDFDIAFSNGGGIQGQGFRLDIEGDSIDDDALAAFVIRDLRLLMVGTARILNKRIIEERHKRSPTVEHQSSRDGRSVFIDLSHAVEDAKLANVGTCLATPRRRSPDGTDLPGIALHSIADLPGVVVRLPGIDGRAIDWQAFAATDLRGRAVLVNTGWDVHWRTDRYFEGHPFLTEKAARYLRDQGAALVGIDSLSIDDTSGSGRPVHSVLLAAGIPIVEHLTGLDRLPIDGFRFSAVPPKAAGTGTFPVRAHARLDPD